MCEEQQVLRYNLTWLPLQPRDVAVWALLGGLDILRTSGILGGPLGVV